MLLLESLILLPPMEDSLPACTLRKGKEALGEAMSRAGLKNGYSLGMSSYVGQVVRRLQSYWNYCC